MAILVNGGAGYIGSHTCIELMKSGYEIIVADNLYNSCEEALRRVEQISGKNVPFVNVDPVSYTHLYGSPRRAFCPSSSAPPRFLRSMASCP